MPTDAPETNTSPDSFPQAPSAVTAWTESRITMGILWVLLGVLAVEAGALSLCLWLLAGREAASVYVSQGG